MKRYKIKPITYFLFFILVVGIIGCVAYFGLVKGNGKSEKDESVTTEKKDSWHDSLSKKRDKKNKASTDDTINLSLDEWIGQ